MTRCVPKSVNARRVEAAQIFDKDLAVTKFLSVPKSAFVKQETKVKRAKARKKRAAEGQLKAIRAMLADPCSVSQVSYCQN